MRSLAFRGSWFPCTCLLLLIFASAARGNDPPIAADLLQQTFKSLDSDDDTGPVSQSWRPRFTPEFSPRAHAYGLSLTWNF